MKMGLQILLSGRSNFIILANTRYLLPIADLGRAQDLSLVQNNLKLRNASQLHLLAA